MYTDPELEAMLADLESDLSERKESFAGDAPTKVREAVCAFANDLPDHRRAGVVFIGTRDDGSPAGLAITDELLLQLADIKTDGNTVPPPTLAVAKRRLNGADMAVIVVEPADSPPVRFKGRIWIRIVSRRATASAQDERILNEKRRHRDRPFDVQPVPSASLADLDRRLFEDTYLGAAFAPDILALNDRSYEQRLAATKMILTADDPTPTVLGLLVLGTRTRHFLPGAYIQFLRIAGMDAADPVTDEQLIDGSIQDLLRRVDEKMASHNRVAVDFTSGSTETRTHLYPLVALQQLVRNAVMHRTYDATNAPIHVYWYDDRIEVSSPGGPYGAITQETFGKAGLVDYRNPNLAEALRVLGFVQRFGFGIPTARRALTDNGNPPPQFTIEPNFVHVAVRAAALIQNVPIQLSDPEIAALIAEPKPLPDDYQSEIHTKLKGVHKERELAFTGKNGSDFRLILRQSRFNVLEFSISLSYLAPKTNRVFRLRRYDGKSHEHTNALESQTFYDFHVHTATERYQLESGRREDTFAEPTDKYSDFQGAIRCMLRDCNFILPAAAQGSLFEEES